MSVLVINSGSSSIKYRLVDPENGFSLASGLVERIGEETGHITHKHDEKRIHRTVPIADHAAGLRDILAMFDEEGPSLAETHISAVGHRIVQGGKYFDGPVIIDDTVEARIEELIPLAPLHNPAHLAGIRVARELLPDIPHVAVFDTAFFQSLPDEAATYAIDQDIADKYAIRRYGAHGTSHQYVSAQIARLLGREDAKQIVLHIGNGASVSAVVAGKAVETSMGLTPLEGLVMGTRCGDIDPAVVFHLSRTAGMSIDEIDNLFNRESGLKGLAGDNDMRMVDIRRTEGDEQAKKAIDVYVHRIVKYIGSYAAVMGGLDAITFTAGVGENAVHIREMVIERLAGFGVKLDPERNAEHGKNTHLISADDSTVQVFVVPTNEELAIAQQAMSVI